MPSTLLLRAASSRGAERTRRVRCVSAWSVLITLGVFSACLNFLALTGPLFMLQIYDRVLPSGIVATLMLLCVLAAGLLVFYAILDLLAAAFVRLAVSLDGRVGDACLRNGNPCSLRGDA